MKRRTEPGRIPLIDILVIFAMCAIAIAQPFYDALTTGTAFFIAHNAGSLEILGLLAAVSVGVPAAIVAIQFVATLISGRLRKILHFVAVFLLAALFVIVTVNRLADTSNTITVLAAAIGGATIASLIYLSAPARNILGIASVGVVYFPALFLLFTPVYAILFGGSQEPISRLKGNPTTPLVIMIFDEMNPLGLLDAENEIDEVRFPNIAAFADDALWFRNAASVHPQSVKAIPAILTGKKPPEAETLASYAGYPDNLLALLANTYDLNVVETFTALCPTIFCPAPEGKSRAFNAAAFFSDLKIVLGHIFLPKQLAMQTLPPLNDGWRDFGRVGLEVVPGAGLANLANVVEAEAAALAATRRQSFKHDRLGPFELFLDNIKPGGGTLDMVHIVFPHTPYEYLPDMTRYNPVLEGNSTWGNDQRVVDESFRAYLLQLAAADSLVGRLAARLKEVGKYEDAMIILVADHGRVFRKGAPKRALSNSTPDVLHTPLFIKLPRQDSGEIRDDFVLTVDIVPTIADALGFDIPWDSDGISLLAPHLPIREGISVSFSGNDFHLKAEDIVSKNAVPDRIAKFGSRTPLEQMTVKNGFSALIGKRVAEVDVSEPPANVQLSANFKPFSNISLTSGYLPLNFKGTITGSTELDYEWVAVAVNGTIAIVAPTRMQGGMMEFTAMLPPGTMQDGASEVTAFLIKESDNSVTKTMLIALTEEALGYELSNRPEAGRAIVAGHEEYRISRTRFHGAADRLEITEDNFIINGWSAEIKTARIPWRIVAFLDGRFIGATLVDIHRGDVAKHFAKQELIRSGYKLSISQEHLRRDAEGLQLFGLTTDGEAITIRLDEKLIEQINSSLGGSG